MGGIVFPADWLNITKRLPIIQCGKYELLLDPVELFSFLIIYVEEALKSKKDEKLALALSGGIDSCILAYCLKELAFNFRVYTLCSSLDHPDCVHATLFAKRYKLEHEIFIPSKAMIEQAKGSVYLLLMQSAKQSGHQTIVCGDGIDEQFGGYPEHRWPKNMTKRQAFEMHWEKLIPKHLIPLNAAAELANIEVILPYLNTQIIKAASVIPIDQRTDKKEGKIPLKQIARHLHFPQEIIEREKWGLVHALSKSRQ